MQDRPMIQHSYRLFRVKPGTWFAPREPGDETPASIASRHIDVNGNIMYRDLEMANSLLAIQAYDAGNLIDVTEDPTRPVFEGEPTGKQPTAEPETVTFVEEDKAVEMPPVQDKPRRNVAKRKREKKQ